MRLRRLPIGDKLVVSLTSGSLADYVQYSSANKLIGKVNS